MISFLLGVLLLALSLVGDVMAHSYSATGAQRDFQFSRVSNSSMTEAQARAIALQRNGGGRVLSVSRSQLAQGRVVYSVKVIKDGNVRVIRVGG